jgi:hypothetical protein
MSKVAELSPRHSGRCFAFVDNIAMAQQRLACIHMPPCGVRVRTRRKAVCTRASRLANARVHVDHRTLLEPHTIRAAHY